MIWRTRFSSLAVSTRPQNETVSSKCFRSPTAAADAVTSRVGHPEEKVQRNLTRLLYGANGQSPGPSCARMHKAEPYATGAPSVTIWTSNMANLRNLLAFCLMVTSLPAAQGRVLRSLAGEWRFELDPSDRGVSSGWFNRALAGTVQLPGTTDTNQQGTKDDVRHADRLSRKWTYTGKAWYQQEIDIPPSWAAKRVKLLLERTRVTRVWLDASEMGAQNVRLSVPHVYDLGKASPGRHRLTILVDNGQRLPAGGHLVSEDTQTNWNGILGRIELMATEPVWMESVRVTPDFRRRVAVVRIRLRNSTGKDFAGTISLRAESFNTKQRGSASADQAVTVVAGEQTADIDLEMGD